MQNWPSLRQGEATASGSRSPPDSMPSGAPHTSISGGEVLPLEALIWGKIMSILGEISPKVQCDLAMECERWGVSFGVAQGAAKNVKPKVLHSSGVHRRKTLTSLLGPLGGGITLSTNFLFVSSILARL